jgi:hypothetical protein
LNLRRSEEKASSPRTASCRRDVFRASRDWLWLVCTFAFVTEPSVLAILPE